MTRGPAKLMASLREPAPEEFKFVTWMIVPPILFGPLPAGVATPKPLIPGITGNEHFEVSRDPDSPQPEPNPCLESTPPTIPEEKIQRISKKIILMIMALPYSFEWYFFW